MWSCKAPAALGVTVASLCALAAPAAAKRVSYQVDGQTYTYESTDREQARIARERMSAAKAAEEAKAQANAEAAANPLVKVFGSQAQTRAAQADAELKRTLSTTGAPTNYSRALPRGNKNIPWDEPGKLNGVPGVQENAATSLSAGFARAQPRAERHRAPAASPAEGVSEAKQSQSADAAPAGIRAYAGVQEAPASAPAEADAGAEAEAEARAKIIAEMKAKARSQEQARLQREKTRDRFARAEPGPTGEPASASLPHGTMPAGTAAAANVGAASGATRADPASTGALAQKYTDPRADIASFVDELRKPEPAPAPIRRQEASSSWKDGLCRMVFFGLLPGC